MKTTIKMTVKLVIIFYLMQNTINLVAQKTVEIDKIDAIINLSKFINWKQHTDKTNEKKLIIIFSNNISSINYEIQSKNNFKYKDWQIICSNKYDNINSGSIVFITKELESELIKIVKISKIKNILTIADDIDDFCENGGMINIKKRNGKFHFEVNYKEIQNQDIEISSKLLALAKIL